VVPRRVATLNCIVQVKVTVSQGVIVHWESPGYNQVTPMYLMTKDASRNVSGDDALQSGIAEIEAVPRALPSFQDREPFLDREAGEKGVVHARYLRSQEISQVLRARDDAVQSPRGLCAGANIVQGSVSEDLDDQFGGEV